MTYLTNWERPRPERSPFFSLLASKLFPYDQRTERFDVHLSTGIPCLIGFAENYFEPKGRRKEEEEKEEEEEESNPNLTSFPIGPCQAAMF